MSKSLELQRLEAIRDLKQAHLEMLRTLNAMKQLKHIL